MNECKKVRGLLALRPEDWSAVEQNRVKAHLTNCPDCAALAEQYAEQDCLIRAAPRVSLTPSQRGQLLARTQRERRRHEMHTKLSAMMGTAAFIAILVALALGLRGLFPQIDQLTPSAPSGPYPTDADEALWVHIDGAWDKDLAHRTTTILQRQPWWDGEIILFTYEDNFPDVADGGRQRVLSWVLAEPDDLEPGWAVLMSGNREVAHWPADRKVPIPTNEVYTFWLSERQDRLGRTLSVIYGPWATPEDVPETVQLILNDQTLDIPLASDSFLYFSEDRLVEKRPEIRWACAAPDGGLCGISLRTDEPRLETEPLVFAGEIRSDEPAVDWLTGKPIPFTIGERDHTDLFAPGRLYIPSYVGWMLTWRVVAPPSADWVVFVHLMNEAGELVLQGDVAVDWPTQPCPEGEYGPECTVITKHEWEFPADFPLGLYTISIGLYDPVTGERAPVTSPPGSTSPVALGQVRVVSDAEAVPTPVLTATPSPTTTSTVAPGTDAVIDCAAIYPGLPGCLQDEPLAGGRLAFVDTRPPFDYRTIVIDLQHGGAWTMGESPGAPRGWSPAGEYLLTTLGEGASAVYRYNGEVAATYGIPHPAPPFWAPPDGFPGTRDWLARPTEDGALEALPFPEGQPRQLLPPGTLGESRLVNVRWSPDGWLAWTLDPDQLANNGHWEQILYVKPVEGGTATTALRLSDDIRETYYQIIDWVPGTRLILAGRLSFLSSSLQADGLPLVAINADTGEITDLGATMLLTPEAYAWHPTQPALLALAEGGGRFIHENKRLALLDVTTGDLHTLTGEDTAAFEPAWSPDGTLLAYAAIPVPPGATGDVETMEHMLDGRAIYVVDPATGESHALTHPGDGIDGWPQLSADGTHLLYTHQHDGITDVRVVALDDSSDELLVTGLADPACFYGGCGWRHMLAYFPGP